MNGEYNLVMGERWLRDLCRSFATERYLMQESCRGCGRGFVLNEQVFFRSIAPGNHRCRECAKRERWVVS